MNGTTLATVVSAETAPPIVFPDWVSPRVVEGWEMIETYPLLAAGLIVVGSFVFAKLSEILICRVVAQLTRRTKTDVDDQFIELVRRPIFITILFFGFAMAVMRLGLPDRVESVLVGLLQTFVVLRWLSRLIRATRTLLDALGRTHERFPVIEERTIPLFDIVGRLLLIGAASYMLLAIWNIKSPRSGLC